MIFDKNILNTIVCPITKEKLIYDETTNLLTNESAQNTYLIKDGIPLLIEDKKNKS